MRRRTAGARSQGTGGYGLDGNNPRRPSSRPAALAVVPDQRVSTMLLPSPRALSGHLRTSPLLVVPNVLVSGQDAKRMRQHNCGVGQVMPITNHSGSPCRGVEARVETLVNPAASLYAPTRR